MHVPIKRPERRTGDCDANERFQIDQTRVESMSRDLLPPLYCPVLRRCRIIGRGNAATPRGTEKLISSSFRMNLEDNKNPNSPSGRKFIARRVVKPGNRGGRTERRKLENDRRILYPGKQEVSRISSGKSRIFHDQLCIKLSVIKSWFLTHSCSKYSTAVFTLINELLFSLSSLEFNCFRIILVAGSEQQQGTNQISIVPCNEVLVNKILVYS